MRQGRAAAALAAAVAAGLAAAACGGDVNTQKGAMKTPYANNADSGASAPATQQSLSPNPSMGDSTVGVSRGTGVANAAGDTAGAHGKAAGAHGAVPGKPTSGPSGSGVQNATGAPRSSTPAQPHAGTPKAP
ncbi:hypothetical protein tb265_22670 [Gemmatimonadetes bacterium T265]|nr:hypothetical protein tb265_22670 [Gemmatimonadetes bacterium T265]